ncbi:MAG: sensor histidine kinase [Acidimicrobiales bacterium]
MTAAAARASLGSAQLEGAPGEIALLLVDDRDENLAALEAALEPTGHRMVCARSGEQALRELLREPDFAAIVLDVQMPGIDGYETAEEIRRRDRTNDVPILFLTAIDHDERHRLKGFAAGAADYIFKPIDPEVLRAKIEVFVRLHLNERRLRAQGELLSRQASELARSNADLEQFAAVVSHDLQEPLNVIAGYLELLVDRLGDHLDEDARRWADTMTACAGRMSALVTEVLSFSQIMSGRAEVSSMLLGDALADALANLDRSIAQAGAEISVPAPLGVAMASRRELARLFQNVIGNCLKHRGDHPPAVTITSERSGNLVTVAVSDDGPGVPLAEMERVYGVFEQAGEGPRPTSGLGLAICRKIISRAGGRIWMEPNKPRGVTVRFTLPAGR